MPGLHIQKSQMGGTVGEESSQRPQNRSQGDAGQPLLMGSNVGRTKCPHQTMTRVDEALEMPRAGEYLGTWQFGFMGD